MSDSDHTVSVNVATRMASANVNESHPTTRSELEQFGMTEDWLKEALRLAGKNFVSDKNIGVWIDSFEGKPDEEIAIEQRFHLKLATTHMKNNGNPQNITLNYTPFSEVSDEVTNKLDYSISHELVSSISKSTSMSSTLSESNTFSISQSIKYEIDGVGGGDSFSYNYEWGKSDTDSQSTTIGSTDRTTIKVPAHSSAQMVITGQKGTVSFDVTFDASIEGNIYYYSSMGDSKSTAEPIAIKDLIQAQYNNGNNAVSGQHRITQHVVIPFYTDYKTTVNNIPNLSLA